MDFKGFFNDFYTIVERLLNDYYTIVKRFLNDG